MGQSAQYETIRKQKNYRVKLLLATESLELVILWFYVICLLSFIN